MSDKNEKAWLVYIIQCTDNAYYTGITNNLEQRVQQHSAGEGAKYFRGRKPVAVVYTEPATDRGSATRREAEIKKMTRAQKIALISD